MLQLLIKLPYSKAFSLWADTWWISFPSTHPGLIGLGYFAKSRVCSLVQHLHTQGSNVWMPALSHCLAVTLDMQWNTFVNQMFIFKPDFYIKNYR